MADNWNGNPRTWSVDEIVSAANLNAELRDRMDAIKASLVGDGSVDADMPHTHLPGTLAARPAAGNVGRIYFATDLGAVFLDDGSRWHIISTLKSVCDYFFDDFTAFTAGTTGNPGWVKGLDTGCSVDILDAQDSIVEIKHGTTASTRARFGTRGATLNHFAVVAARVPAILEFKAKQTDPPPRGYMGMTNATPASGANPVDFIGFRSLGANWFTVTRAGGVETAQDTGTGGFLFHRFRIEIMSVSAIDFYFDDVKVGSTHTTNIPVNGQTLWFMADDAAAAAKTIQVDQVEWASKRA